MIPQRDLVKFEKALIGLYSPGLSLDNYAGRSFEFVNSLFESDLSGLMVRDTARASLQITIDQVIPDFQKVGEAFSKLGPKYPWFLADPSIHNGRPHSRSDFCSDRQFRNLDIHSEVFRFLGYRHFLSMYLHSEQDKVVFFGFNRGGSDFSPRERELVSLARAHLSSARHLAVALSAGKEMPLTLQLLARMNFTPRESEVLYWLVEGKSNVEIAAILHIQLSTVKGYLTDIYNKIGTGNRHATILHVLSQAKKLNSDLPVASPEQSFVETPYPLAPTKVG
jgi:DNA-binding CsgD family transcriptional regulator